MSKNRHCRSPPITLALLRLEHRWLEDYKAYHAHTAADTVHKIDSSIRERLDQLKELAKRHDGQIQLDALVVEEYVSGFCCPVLTLGQVPNVIGILKH